MSIISKDSNTAYADVDWDAYMKARPLYPESLKQIIYAYHKSRLNAGWDRVVDVGAGVGIASTLFAPDFRTIHLLDPAPLNHEQAKSFLDQWLQQRSLQTSLEFTQAPAERACESIHREADLVICATSAHFIDPDGLVEAAAHMLKPGGTLAIYSYWFPIFPDQSREFSEAFGRLVMTTLRLCLQQGDDATRSAFTKVGSRISTDGKGVLNSIPMPETLFDRVERIYINPAAQKWAIAMSGRGWVPFPSIAPQTRAAESEFFLDSDEDPEAHGWSFQVDNDWLHGFLATIRPRDMIWDEAQDDAIYGDWDKLFAKECPSGSTRSLWPVQLVLGSRREL